MGLNPKVLLAESRIGLLHARTYCWGLLVLIGKGEYESGGTCRVSGNTGESNPDLEDLSHFLFFRDTTREERWVCGSQACWRFDGYYGDG